MKIVEELNKGWQIQGFDQGTLGFEEVERFKEGWIAAQANLNGKRKKLSLFLRDWTLLPPFT